ncbi:MAG: sugar ABC transporter ATP-binding protein [Clostridia bacterium]
MRSEVLRLERITYREQGITQLNNFNLNVFHGEIMGLLPINNHGLAALTDLLCQNRPLYYGYVYYREELVNSWRAPRHGYNRVSLIQSKSCLVEGLTVADNIFVLRPGFRGYVIRPHLFREQLQPFLQSIGINISASAYVEELTVFKRFVVELLKAVVAGNRLIVLKDVSPFVSESELSKIHAIVRHYAQQGFSFLYIGFHLEELMEVCGRMALMLNGRVIKVLEGAEITPSALKPYTETYDGLVRRQLARDRSAAVEGATVFEAAGLCGGNVNELSFAVHAGECLVLQDLDNRMLGDLLPMLTGEQRPEKGHMLLEGQPFFPTGNRGVAVMQELPSESMLFPSMNVLDNLCFTLDHRLPGIWRSARLRRGLRKEYATWFSDELMSKRVEDLTEAEKYQLVYVRILLQHPRVLFCVQPFRRADVALRMHIWNQLERLLDSNIAVVILAVNLADSLSLADRLIRVHTGQPMEVYERANFAHMDISAPWMRLYREEG